MEDTARKLAVAFEKIYSLDGVVIMDKTYNLIPVGEIGFKGEYVNYYLILDTISKMIRAGDIKVEIISDVSKKKDYFTRLLDEIQ